MAMWLVATVLDSTGLTHFRPRRACFLPKPVPGETPHLASFYNLTYQKSFFVSI